MTDEAKFKLGQVVRHRLFDFRGIIFDVDPLFNNTDEWYERIPEERRPRKDQPFYHLLDDNDEISSNINRVRVILYGVVGETEPCRTLPTRRRSP